MIVVTPFPVVELHKFPTPVQQVQESRVTDQGFNGWLVPRHLLHRGIIEVGDECRGCAYSHGTDKCGECICYAPKEIKQSHPILKEVL